MIIVLGYCIRKIVSFLLSYNPCVFFFRLNAINANLQKKIILNDVHCLITGGSGDVDMKFQDFTKKKRIIFLH